jgi:hypothetical protein
MIHSGSYATVSEIPAKEKSKNTFIKIKGKIPGITRFAKSQDRFVCQKNLTCTQG